MSFSSSRPVRTRIAPSPTGFLHIGGLRTVLYDYFLARQSGSASSPPGGGQFILRIEDTDRERLVPGAVEHLLKTFADFDLDYDEGPVLNADGTIGEKGSHGPYVQSQRLDIYKKFAEQLLKDGHAYPCFCSPDRLREMREAQVASKQAPKYDRACLKLSTDEVQSRFAKNEPHVLRMKIPEGSSSFTDPIRGTVTFDNAEVDDQVLLKSDGFPTYHLAVVIDDHLMEITHVLRGEEWLSSTPKQIILHKMLGWDMPVYAHVPLILNPDKTKLSKRQGDVSAESYLEKGYVPEALENFLALLGWNPTADREIFSRDELVKLFDLSKVNKAGAVMNIEKLNWMNGQYLRALPAEEYLETCRSWMIGRGDPLRSPSDSFDRQSGRPEGRHGGLPLQDVDRAFLMVRDRLQVLSELPALTDFLFKEKLEHDASLFAWKTQTPEQAHERLTALREELVNWTEKDFEDATAVETKLRALMNARGWENGDTLWPLRVALSAQKQSPGPFELLVAYGKERALARIKEAIERLT